MPQEIDRDPFEGILLTDLSEEEAILQRVAAQGDEIMQTIKRSGPDVLYEQARANRKAEEERIVNQAEASKKRRDDFNEQNPRPTCKPVEDMSPLEKEEDNDPSNS